METKQCTGCGETKSIEEFRKDARGLMGRESRCKDCKNAYGKIYREKNRERINALHRERYGGAYHKPYRGRYREQDKKRKKLYRARNPHVTKAQKAIWTEVRAGRMPKASTLSCSHCSSDAAHYHHHLGYSLEHWLDVIPLCQSCHILAEKSQQTTKKKANNESC